MNADNEDFKYRELTEKIIKIFYTVYNKLGYDFLEKVYEKAMMKELKKEDIPAVSQYAITVVYEDEIIGENFTDILVDNKVIVEIKAAKGCQMIYNHVNIFLNIYHHVNIFFNISFGPKPDFK